MRIALLGAAAALLLTVATRGSAAPVVSGDYLEARTANVFIGACHAGSEYGTMGREAVLAWRFREGTFQGADLSGLAAVAVIAGNENLSRNDVKRRSVLYLDASATPKQRAALRALLEAKYGAALGTVLAVKPAPITLEEMKTGYRLRVADAVRLDVSKEADRSCCTMPMQVWYEPFIPVNGSKIGYTALNAFAGAETLPSWSRVGQNSAIFGTFGF